MRAKNILGIVILIGGVALIAFSVFLRNYAKTASLEEILKKQEQLEQGTGFVPRRPFPGSKDEQTRESVTEIMDEDEKAVDIYMKLSKWSKISGIIFILLGTGFFLIKKA